MARACTTLVFTNNIGCMPRVVPSLPPGRATPTVWVLPFPPERPCTCVRLTCQEVDDFANNANCDTHHRVWVSMPYETGLPQAVANEGQTATAQCPPNQLISNIVKPRFGPPGTDQNSTISYACVPTATSH